MRYRLDLLDGLVVFEAVASRASFSAAARDLRVTRSAVSQAISALEARLGVTLLARTTRSVSLTEAGARFLETVGPALAAIAGATEALASPDGQPTGLLRINAPRLAVAMLLAPILPDFLRAFPGVSVEIFTEDRFADIVADGFDAGVRLGELLDADMVSVRLSPPDRLVVVGSPIYLASHGRPAHPRQLAAHACINFRQSAKGGLYRWEFQECGKGAAGEISVAVEGRVIVNDTDAKLRAALEGLGLAYELETVVRPFLAEGLLEEVLADWSAATPGFHLYFPSRRQVAPKLRAFIDFARERARC
jgi:DNA-binding transcriptional LysR family regulator